MSIITGSAGHRMVLHRRARDCTRPNRPRSALSTMRSTSVLGSVALFPGKVFFVRRYRRHPSPLTGRTHLSLATIHHRGRPRNKARRAREFEAAVLIQLERVSTGWNDGEAHRVRGASSARHVADRGKHSQQSPSGFGVYDCTDPLMNEQPLRCDEYTTKLACVWKRNEG